MIILLISRRQEYTHDDDMHLAAYIASRIPLKEEGGRTGNVIYKELCEEVRLIPMPLYLF